MERETKPTTAHHRQRKAQAQEGRSSRWERLQGCTAPTSIALTDGDGRAWMGMSWKMEDCQRIPHCILQHLLHHPRVARSSQLRRLLCSAFNPTAQPLQSARCEAEAQTPSGSCQALLSRSSQRPNPMPSRTFCRPRHSQHRMARNGPRPDLRLTSSEGTLSSTHRLWSLRAHYPTPSTSYISFPFLS